MRERGQGRSPDFYITTVFKESMEIKVSSLFPFPRYASRLKTFLTYLLFSYLRISTADEGVCVCSFTSGSDSAHNLATLVLETLC